ncbi:unnamed protein product [Amoebophrya sp. A25]|nr:unnamed protein product [Amoebophrya sp. A25]|eukprot:GSA25T00008019001.1
MLTCVYARPGHVSRQPQKPLSSSKRSTPKMQSPYCRRPCPVHLRRLVLKRVRPPSPRKKTLSPCPPGSLTSTWYALPSLLLQTTTTLRESRCTGRLKEHIVRSIS